jgi:hypothetical protein
MPPGKLFPLDLRTAVVPDSVIRSVPPNLTNDSLGVDAAMLRLSLHRALEADR